MECPAGLHDFNCADCDLCATVAKRLRSELTAMQAEVRRLRLASCEAAECADAQVTALVRAFDEERAAHRRTALELAEVLRALVEIQGAAAGTLQ